MMKGVCVCVCGVCVCVWGVCVGCVCVWGGRNGTKVKNTYDPLTGSFPCASFKVFTHLLLMPSQIYNQDYKCGDY